MDAALVAKIAALFIVLAISVILGNAPYWVLKRRQTPQGTRWRNLFISIFNAFSGGVFLGTCLLHLMAEGREELEDAFEAYGVEMEYPLFDVFVAFGFFVIILIDFVAEQCFHRSNSIEGKARKRSISPIDSEVTSGGDVASEGNMGRYKTLVPMENKNAAVSENNNIAAEGPSQETKITSASNGKPSSSEVVIPDTSHHAHEFGDLAKASAIRSVLLLIALSFHSIFDGLAIGLQNEEFDVWQVLIAISMHKALVAFCLGLQLYQAYKERTKLAIILVQIFAIISPLGIIIGIIITSSNIDDTAKTMTSAILQGIAAGTFLYVTFFEILSTAFAHGQSIWNIVVATVGFAAMAGVKVLDAD